MKIQKLFFFLILIFPLISYANFLDLGIGVRPMGMGGAFVAIADDSSATFWNSAGLTQIESREISFCYTDLYSGLNAQLFNGETDQIGYHSVNFAFPIGTSENVIAGGILFFNSAFYDEQIYLFTFAKQFTQKLRGGFNAKFLRFAIADTAYVRADSSIPSVDLDQSTATADLTILFKFNDRVSFGLIGENLLPTDIGVIENLDLPIRIVTGIAHRTRNFSQALDFVWRNREVNGDADVRVRFGLERWFFDRQFAIRGGYNIDAISLGATIVYVGKSNQAQLDYAFLYPIGSVTNTNGSHRVGLSIRF